MTTRTRRTGFTLVETIVTVGLIAVLAAFVVPTVIQKSGAGDPVKVVNDLQAIRTAMETFFTDTKAGYPNLVWQLTSKPSTANHLVDSASAAAPGTALSSGQIDKWNGPYIAATIGTLTSDQMPTAFTATIQNHIQRYDVDANKGEHSGGTTGATFSTANQLFTALRVNGLTLAQAQLINQAIDGTNDPDVGSGTDQGANATGRFRFDKPNAQNIVVAYFMATPITQ
jgi:prepilin-type N-terminal cleavage/methylation domain-containing protein